MKRFIFLLTTIFICGAAIAQTETTKWYIEGELYDTTSCESGDDITMPQVPERFGYTFSGWEPAVYDMSTLDKTINGSRSSCNNNTTWQVTFSYGTVYGEALYSNNMCYCRITHFKPTGDYKIYEPLFSGWVADRNATACCGDCKQYVGNGANHVRAQLYRKK